MIHDADTAFVAACEYRTEKTLTRDIVAVTRTGILSIKVVESANGHKTNVYTGFDVPQAASALHESCLDDVDFYSHILDHKYRNAQFKAVEKWKGEWIVTDAMSPDGLIKTFGLDGAINGKVAEHFEEAFPAVTDADLRRREPPNMARAYEPIGKTKAALRAEEAMRNDPTWGMF